MKFHFTVQPYQTDAVEAVVRVFEGQPYAARTTYLRDVGTGVAHAISIGRIRSPRRSARVLSMWRWRRGRARRMSIARRCSS